MLDAVELVNPIQGNEKQLLIQALAAFLTNDQEGDAEFLSSGYNSEDHVQRFNNSHYKLLDPLMREDQVSIHRALTAAFDAARAQYHGH